MRRPRLHGPTALGLSLALLSGLASPQQVAEPSEEPADTSRPVVVATRAVPPFAMQRDDGTWYGLAIDLWEQAASRLALSPTYVEAGLAEMLDGVASGEFDAAASALTATVERERRVDFSHPFLTSGLGIAVRAEGGTQLLTVFTQLVSPAFLRVVLALSALLLVCGVLVWLFERRANPEQFGSGLAGVGSGFWWSAVTMTTVGYGDKAPATLGGRVVGLVWMFTSIIVISSFTAAITSSLTVSRLETAIQGPDDLPGARVGTIVDSTGQAWTERQLLRATPFTGAGDALAALASGDLDAVVYDAPVLQHLVSSRHQGELTVLPARLERQDYAFALPEDGTLREELNQVVLDVTSSPEWERVLSRYLGS